MKIIPYEYFLQRQAKIIFVRRWTIWQTINAQINKTDNKISKTTNSKTNKTKTISKTSRTTNSRTDKTTIIIINICCKIINRLIQIGNNMYKSVCFSFYQSKWKTGFKSTLTGLLSGLVSMMLAMKSHHFLLMAVSAPFAHFSSSSISM